MKTHSLTDEFSGRELPVSAVADLVPGYAERKRHGGSSGFRLLLASDIKFDGGVDWSGLALCDSRAAASRALVVDGDVLLTVRTSSPRAILVVRPPSDVVAGAPFTLLRPRSGLVDARYLRWVLNAPRVNGRLRAAFRGSAMPFLATKDLAQFLVPVPSLARQRMLARADQLLRRTARLSAQLDAATVQLLEAAATLP